MQRLLAFIFFLLTIPRLSFTQEVLNAGNLSQYQSTGTARILAMGGSSNALGGDITSAYNNPAGLSQFKTNEMVFSPGVFLNRTNMMYNDDRFKDDRTRMNLGTTGVLFSFYHYNRKRKIIRTNVAVALNQTANFNTDFSYRGENRNSSYSEKWAEELISNNIRNFDDALVFSPAGASLPVENYLVDSIMNGPNISGYRTNVNTGLFPINQSFAYRTSGSVNELALSLAQNHTEKFYYGFTLGLPMLRRTEISTIEERDISGNTNNDFESFRFKETVTTKGTGILLRAGILYKPFEYFRIGLNIQSPTFYTLSRTMDAQLQTSVENYAIRINGNDSSRSKTFNLSTRDITGGNEYTYDYRFSTPWRAAIALAYVFRETENVKHQRGMVTAEAEIINHQSVNLSNSATENNPNTSDYYKQLNKNIRLIYRPAFNFRIGGEIKFHTIMFRGGFQYLQSPFEKNALPTGVKGYRLIPSFGVGYRDKGIFADITYSHSIGDGVHFPYFLEKNIYPYATSNINNGQILATIGFKF